MNIHIFIFARIYEIFWKIAKRVKENFLSRPKPFFDNNDHAVGVAGANCYAWLA